VVKISALEQPLPKPAAQEMLDWFEKHPPVVGTWRKRFAVAADGHGADIRAADIFLRRLDLNLRTPDAIHIAIARRLGAELATFDVRMAESAEALGAASVAV
jgi:predicted nucleic acid-binding protein